MANGQRVSAPPIAATVLFCLYVVLAGCGDQKPMTDLPGSGQSHATVPADHNSEPWVSAHGLSESGSLAPGQFALGAKDFKIYCLACHGGDGGGSHSAPPLTGSPWLAGVPSRPIRIILHGVKGPIEVGGGKIFNREMPGFERILSDARIANLLTFVRQKFGKSTDAVTPETVAKVRFDTRDRSSYWTAAELLALPP